MFPDLCQNCESAIEFLDKNKKGFCSGLARVLPEKIPKDDVILLCFINSSEKSPMFMKPSEALSIATLLTGAYEAWAKRKGVKI